MKKVMFVASDNYFASGAFKSMVKLCQLINQSGRYRATVILPCKGNGEQLLKDAGIQYKKIKSCSWTVPIDVQMNFFNILKITIKRLINLVAIVRMLKYIKNENIDLIHINTTWSYVGAYAAKKAKIPFVWHIREMLEEDQNRKLWDCEGKKIMCSANYNIAISKYVYNKYEKVLNNKRLVLVHNGIDEKEYFFEKKFDNRMEKKEVIFVCVGGLSSSKGQLDILHAVYLLKKRDFELKLFLVGAGGMEHKYKQYVEEHQLTKSVIFCGAKKNVLPYYQRADVMIMSSKAEAFGRTTVEAMMSGCAVIATDAGANREILDNGKCGLLYERGNCKQLAECMEELIVNPNKLNDIAIRGQNFAMENFTAKKNAEQVINIYDKIFHNDNNLI